MARQGLFFDAAFYVPRDMASGQFQKAFDWNKSPYGPIQTAWKEKLLAVGKFSGLNIRGRFQEKHDVTGATARSMSQQLGSPFEGNPNVSVYSIGFGGGVRYVINPIRAHTITFRGDKGALYNPNIESMERMTGNREQRFHQNFGEGAIDKTIEWHQHGEDSYGPDRSWYEADTAMMQKTWSELRSMAARVELFWGEQSQGGFVSVTRPQASGGYVLGSLSDMGEEWLY